MPSLGCRQIEASSRANRILLLSTPRRHVQRPKYVVFLIDGSRAELVLSSGFNGGATKLNVQQTHWF
jgi:hypothetical protein